MGRESAVETCRDLLLLRCGSGSRHASCLSRLGEFLWRHPAEEVRVIRAFRPSSILGVHASHPPDQFWNSIQNASLPGIDESNSDDPCLLNDVDDIVTSNALSNTDISSRSASLTRYGHIMTLCICLKNRPRGKCPIQIASRDLKSSKTITLPFKLPHSMWFWKK